MLRSLQQISPTGTFSLDYSGKVIWIRQAFSDILCPQRFNVLLDRCYATTSPYPNLNTYYDLFVGWDTFVQYANTVYTVTTWRLTSLYSLYSHTACLPFPKVHTWRTNKDRAQWRVSEGAVFLWSLPICGAKKSDNIHVLPALRHPPLRGVFLQWITARK